MLNRFYPNGEWITRAETSAAIDAAYEAKIEWAAWTGKDRAAFCANGMI